MVFMRAHGQEAGPTQRPALAGGVSGALAVLPSAAILGLSGAAHRVVSAFGTPHPAAWIIWLVLSVFGGVLYGWIFQRAANDRHGGWLFGIGFGFLAWMLGPVTLLQSFGSRPLITGRPAIGMLLAHLIFGLTLGVLFPMVHSLWQRRHEDSTGQITASAGRTA